MRIAFPVPVNHTGAARHLYSDLPTAIKKRQQDFLPPLILDLWSLTGLNCKTIQGVAI